MARGWESKAVADQLEQTDMHTRDKSAAYEVSPAVRARRERLESLRMSRTRTLEQLNNATTPTHREMLERTLRAIEAEMKDLN
ncbi:MAG TPA: hypothetical protein VF666_15140 [Pyrinomonadaceae bacterium]|jgi:hypothetical protein